uniref:Uncharacterized protein n=1 Tax=Arundo donax TaxID=35708 RepID=A0A0A9FE81_ARUDO
MELVLVDETKLSMVTTAMSPLPPFPRKVKKAWH